MDARQAPGRDREDVADGVVSPAAPVSDRHTFSNPVLRGDRYGGISPEENLGPKRSRSRTEMVTLERRRTTPTALAPLPGSPMRVEAAAQFTDRELRHVPCIRCGAGNRSFGTEDRAGPTFRHDAE